MRNIDFKELVAHLRTAEEQQTFTPPPISQYVRQHIYEPLLRGEQVLFVDLDFTAFNDDDLLAVEDYINSVTSNTSHLMTLNEVFCRNEPVSLKRRAFC